MNDQARHNSIHAPASRALRCAAVAIAVCVAAACSREEPKSTASAPVMPPAVTPRVVALSPAIAVVMQDSGLDNLIVGRHAYDIVMPRSVPSCGEQGTIDYETLLATRPTHVFVQWGKQDLPPRLLELGTSKQWIVENFDILSLDEIDRAQKRLNELLSPSKPLPSERLTSARIRSVQAAHPDLVSRGTVLLIASAGPTFGILGPGSCHAQVLDRLGIHSAITTGGAWSNMDAEDIRALNPSGIIFIQPRAWGAAAGAPSIDELRQTLGALSRLKIPAVNDGRIGFIDDPLSLIPSTSMASFADDVARIVSRWPESEQK